MDCFHLSDKQANLSETPPKKKFKEKWEKQEL